MHNTYCVILGQIVKKNSCKTIIKAVADNLFHTLYIKKKSCKMGVSPLKIIHNILDHAEL